MKKSDTDTPHDIDTDIDMSLPLPLRIIGFVGLSIGIGSTLVLVSQMLFH